MKLLLFRHGHAEDAADASKDGGDAARPLTREGKRRTADAARGLTRLMDRPEVILTSPKIRAVQTAEIIAAAFAKDMQPQVLPALGGGSVNRIAHHLARRAEAVVIAVGHEPALSQTAELLATGAHAGAFIQLKKAGCICLEIDSPNGGARVIWVATGKMLRLMSK